MLPESVLWVALGSLVGAYGALVGVGGGFFIVPVLLLLLKATPQQAIGSSLTVVFFIALSATLSYAAAHRVDYRLGWRFALATVPGALIGTHLSSYFTAATFGLAFGALLAALAVLILAHPPTDTLPEAGASAIREHSSSRVIVDSAGNVFAYSFDERWGILLSLGVGFFSSIMGIGGGIIHVPALVYLMHFPPHVAVATSTFILLFSAMAGAGAHLLMGHQLAGPIVPLTLGVIAGTQIEAHLAGRLRGVWLVRSLAVALGIVGVRLMSAGF